MTNATETVAKRRTLTVEEAAQRLGIGRNAAYLGVQRGEIPAIRLGRRWLVPTDRLDRLLTGEEHPSARGQAQ
jgi:excisionase family DNA binding protein